VVATAAGVVASAIIRACGTAARTAAPSKTVSSVVARAVLNGRRRVFVRAGPTVVIILIVVAAVIILIVVAAVIILIVVAVDREERRCAPMGPGLFRRGVCR
jgi:hypothetical protein